MSLPIDKAYTGIQIQGPSRLSLPENDAQSQASAKDATDRLAGNAAVIGLRVLGGSKEMNACAPVDTIDIGASIRGASKGASKRVISNEDEPLEESEKNPSSESVNRSDGVPPSSHSKLVVVPSESEDRPRYIETSFPWKGEIYTISKFNEAGDVFAYPKKEDLGSIGTGLKQDLQPIATLFSADEARLNLEKDSLLIEGKEDLELDCTHLKVKCKNVENRANIVEYPAGQKPSPNSPFNHLLLKKVTDFTFDIDRVPRSDATGISKQRTANGEKYYRINARFKGHDQVDGVNTYSDDRIIGFRIRAKSMKVALSMIEAYGRQMKFETLDDAGFENIRSRFLNKKFTAMINVSQNANQSAKITFLTQDYNTHKFECAFGPKPGSNSHYYGHSNEIQIGPEQLKIIEHKAKLRKISSSRKPNIQQPAANLPATNVLLRIE